MNKYSMLLTRSKKKNEFSEEKQILIQFKNKLEFSTEWIINI